MKKIWIIACLALIGACAQFSRPSGVSIYYKGESTPYAVDGKTVVGGKGNFLLKLVIAKDRSEMYEKRSYNRANGVVESESLLTRIGNSDGYQVEGLNSKARGLMSYSNEERSEWSGQVFFESGNTMTYSGFMKDGKGKTEAYVYGRDKKLMSISKDDTTLITAEEYAQLEKQYVFKK